MRTSFMIRRWWIGLVFLASFRLAHINLLWADEDYHLSAAIQILNGHVPYRDFWYDKPPLAAIFYLLVGGFSGWPLRVLDICFVLACCVMAYRLACTWWGPDEGRTAALLLAFSTTFYLTSATIPFAVDGLLLLPHLSAIYFAFERRAFWSGFCCAMGLLTNVKAVFIVATCALWLPLDLLLFAGGLSVPVLVAIFAAAWLSLLGSFFQQVWQWGLVYASSSGSIVMSLRRAADWLGFHFALLAGSFLARNEVGYRMAVWLLLSCIPLALGNQLAPRYFFQVLPVLVILASRGIVLGMRQFPQAGVVALALMLMIPLVRFAPRYGELILDNWRGRQTTWPDAALDVDSQRVADFVNSQKRKGDTIFVWGYRPDIYVYTRMLPDGKFSDSQPLDGVSADRHLTMSNPSAGISAELNRAEFVKTEPTFVVDGLGLLNPRLNMERFSDLRSWLARYRLVGSTKLSRIYRREP